MPTAYSQGLEKIQTIYSEPKFLGEKGHFARVLGGEIANLPIEEIKSGDYVIYTLEASFWCLLKQC